MHQDIGLEAGSLEELARLLVSSLRPEQRRELRPYIDHLTQSLTPAEMKGVLNRASRAVRFSPKAAEQLLAAAAERLRAEDSGKRGDPAK